MNYMDHCEWAFSKFGIRATSWLSTKEHFGRWMRRYFKDNDSIRDGNEADVFL